ncbi:MAG: tRNA (adenosine(37)-N6)-threonylcarbamoyltransferase complex ATPase subunit type 1 TsaE [Saprospiraceae bacterium]|nr:tRNA (adenosine(37)-N6)-threonylcarbamoyltransferase complex ATPase subunit type 1 TsaE [Saprospiraceae bacterium]
MYEFESGPVIPDAVLSEWIHIMLPFKIWCLESNLGGGKTHLVRQFGRMIGFEHEVSSPTFSIVNQYSCKPNPFGFETIYHADLYRLNSLEEAHDSGLMEYLFANSLIIIEWPELIRSYLQHEKYAWIQISPVGIDSRKYTLNLIS